MEMNDIVQSTQKWAKANGLDSVKVDQVLSNMDMSDFMVFSQAFETKDMNTISQMYHQAESMMSESRAFFEHNLILEASHPELAELELLQSIPLPQLTELFKRLPGAPITCENVTVVAMQVQLFEYGIPSSTVAAKATSQPFGQAPAAPQQVNTPITPQQAQLQADQAQQLDTQAPNIAEPGAIEKPQQVNQVEVAADGAPAGIVDPKAKKMAMDPELQAMGDELGMDPEELARMASLAGLIK